MKIVHLSTVDISGGAARAAYRLHKTLCRLGQNSSMLVARSTSNDPTVMTVKPSQDILSRLKRRLRRQRIARDFAPYRTSRPEGYEVFSDDRSPHGSDLLRQLPSCDIINIHWVAGFLDYERLFCIHPSTPIVWTLHDMNPFTGGCHYDLGCGRYTTRCGKCPQLGSSDDRDLAFDVWQRKEMILSHVSSLELRIVAPSRWLAGEVKRSPLMSRFSVDVIPNGIDVEAYAPRDRAAARDVLGIPQDAKVVLFLADVVDNRRKGFDLFMQSLQGCAKRVNNLMLLSLGQNAPKRDPGIPWVHFGFVSDDRLLSFMYSAADLFVIPSLQDNLPNTVLEAMACGIPVVGFAVGGIPDMVRHGLTGLLVPPYEIKSLETAIVELLEDRVRRKEMSIHCRRAAIEEYSVELQAHRYSELYKSLG
jgi:glycosyltransferase involved in cell wall biosynthesis